MDYVFATALASGESAKLLGRERLGRMIDSGDADEALRIALESGFGGGSTSDMEAAVVYEEQQLAGFIRDCAPSEKIKTYLLSEYDYHNAEALMKAKYLKVPTDGMLRPSGRCDVTAMREKIFKDEYCDFSAPLREALESADSEFLNGTGGLRINSIFTRALYRELREAARGEHPLAEICDFRIDTLNIQTALRARNLALAEEMFVPGGTLDEYLLHRICEDSPEAILADFKVSLYQEYVGSALEALAEGRPFVDCENMADSYAVRLLKQDRFLLEGFYPFYLYCLYKANELKNVRIILVGLNNGATAGEIRGRLRECYEG